MTVKGEDDRITQYWLKHYMADHCTLCGNSGVIDTRAVRTPIGVLCGRLNWCICPNGQIMRYHTKGKLPEEV